MSKKFLKVISLALALQILLVGCSKDDVIKKIKGEVQGDGSMIISEIEENSIQLIPFNATTKTRNVFKNEDNSLVRAIFPKLKSVNADTIDFSKLKHYGIKDLKKVFEEIDSSSVTFLYQDKINQINDILDPSAFVFNEFDSRMEYFPSSLMVNTTILGNLKTLNLLNKDMSISGISYYDRYYDTSSILKKAISASEKYMNEAYTPESRVYDLMNFGQNIASVDETFYLTKIKILDNLRHVVDKYVIDEDLYWAEKLVYSRDKSTLKRLISEIPEFFEKSVDPEKLDMVNADMWGDLGVRDIIIPSVYRSMLRQALDLGLNPEEGVKVRSIIDSSTEPASSVLEKIAEYELVSDNDTLAVLNETEAEDEIASLKKLIYDSINKDIETAKKGNLTSYIPVSDNLEAILGKEYVKTIKAIYKGDFQKFVDFYNLYKEYYIYSQPLVFRNILIKTGKLEKINVSADYLPEQSFKNFVASVFEKMVYSLDDIADSLKQEEMKETTLIQKKFIQDTTNFVDETIKIVFSDKTSLNRLKKITNFRVKEDVERRLRERGQLSEEDLKKIENRKLLEEKFNMQDMDEEVKEYSEEETPGEENTEEMIEPVDDKSTEENDQIKDMELDESDAEVSEEVQESGVDPME